VNAPLPVGALDRRTYIGGSDAAAIFGVSKWTTPIDLWLKKIARQPDAENLTAEKKKFFRRRKEQEPFIANMMKEEYGMDITRLSLDDNPNRYIDAEHDFLAAEIDFEFVMTESVRLAFPERPDFAAIPLGTLLNGEIKTVHPFSAGDWGEHGSEEVPIYYAAQVMHGLGVTRRPAAVVAALFGLDNLLCFPVMADPELIEPMRAECVRFWNEYVIKRVPPPMVELADFAKLYTRFEGKPVEINDDVQALLDTIVAARREAKLAEERKTEAEFGLAAFLAAQWGVPLIDDDGKLEVASTDNAIFTRDGVPVFTYARTRGAHLDQRRLREEKPEITAAYTNEHFYRALRAAKKPKGSK